MSAIALIACDHGFGHVKRCYHYGLNLARNGHRVTLYARKDGLDRFSQMLGTHYLMTLVPFHTKTEPLKPFIGLVEWLEYLPDLNNFDHIVSDNLPEILSLYPEAILSGSFFWHLDFQGIDSEYIRFCQKLLSVHQPTHLAAELFVSEELSQVSKIVPVGLIGSMKRSVKLSSKKGALLISGGKNSILNEELERFVLRISELIGPIPFSKVYVDQCLLPKCRPEWMRKAEFDETMYQALSTAIIRPGVGTVTDCLRYSVTILAVAEAGNKEMQTNIAALEKFNLGMVFELADQLEDVIEKDYFLKQSSGANRTVLKFNAEQRFASFFSESAAHGNGK